MRAFNVWTVGFAGCHSILREHYVHPWYNHKNEIESNLKIVFFFLFLFGGNKMKMVLTTRISHWILSRSNVHCKNFIQFRFYLYSFAFEKMPITKRPFSSVSRLFTSLASSSRFSSLRRGLSIELLSSAQHNSTQHFIHMDYFMTKVKSWWEIYWPWQILSQSHLNWWRFY